MYVLERKLGQAIVVQVGGERFAVKVLKLTPSFVRIGLHDPQRDFKFLRLEHQDLELQQLLDVADLTSVCVVERPPLILPQKMG